MQILRVELAGDGGVRLYTERQIDDAKALPRYIAVREVVLEDDDETQPARKVRRPRGLPVVAPPDAPAASPEHPSEE